MGGHIDQSPRLQQRPTGTGPRRALIVIFPVLFVALIVFAPGLLAARHYDWPMGLGLGLRLGIGVPVFAAGLALYLWTIALFARAGGTQVPVAPPQLVVTTGPYAVSRNPMVTATVIMIGGAALGQGSWAFLAGGLVIPSFYFAYIKLVEEEELEARFGAAYAAYKRSTPFIVPRLRGRRTSAPRPPNEDQATRP